MRLRKQFHPRPTRRKPPRRDESGRAPLKLSKAGARGLKESLDKNSPKTPKYYHIPREPRVRAAEVAMLVLFAVVLIACIWSLTCVHRLGYEAGRGEGWNAGYAAGIEAASGGPGL
ncbi:hypothetical protein [Adlercreutzia caecimuris]|uniref:Uncharacterized protein n=1 Tax=Adlercreutzia caecimuris TaxID=671266 RepID=A0A4S4G118_9ACTN|nr:hypothetical protein [Adlercreutzia caecimuris]THG36873.1 hypothetical protein E5986_08200 [Adlercreutzia caecimuris]